MKGGPWLRGALDHFSVLRLTPTLYTYRDANGYGTAWSVEHTCEMALKLINELDPPQKTGAIGRRYSTTSRQLLLLSPLT